MNSIDVLRSYVESVLSSVGDMKILLLDQETTEMVSLVFTQTELLRHDVVLIEPLSKCVEKTIDPAISSMQCICIVRPTNDNLHSLCHELNRPHFGSYYIFFTNTVDSNFLTQIAYSDHFGRVSVVHEIFIDAYALNKRLFSLGVSKSLLSLDRHDDSIAQRIVDGLFAILCAFKNKPVIRYDASSEACNTISQALVSKLSSNPDLFQSVSETALLLIIDRRTDPLTPLLHGWSYQSLLQEAMPFSNNIATLLSDPKKSIVVDERTDEFFAENLNTSFGDLGQNVTNLSASIKAQQTDINSIKDIEALKRFIQTYPSFKEKSAVAARHTNLISEITNAVRKEDLMKLSALEQSIASENSVDEHFGSVIEALKSPKTTNLNALRISILFAMRYGAKESKKLDEIKENLVAREDGHHLCQTVDKFISFAGNRSEIFGSKSIVTKAKSLFGISANENKFMQHVPYISSIIQRVEKQSLEREQFPFALGSAGAQKKVIIFILGGATYEEGRVVYEASSGGQLDIVLGGTTIHSMESFVKKEALSE